MPQVSPRPLSKHSGMLLIGHLIRPHWKALAIALLAVHNQSRTGDLLTRVTSDIDAIQDFINTALLGIVINLLTLGGMLGVMFYVDWRFTLIGLSVAPVLFLVVYFYTQRIKKASRV